MDMLPRRGWIGVGLRAGFGSPKASPGGEEDVFVGNRVRMCREALGISQGKLGRELGVTHSQIQKYETGQNRIGAGRLYQLATFLGVPVSHFFEGLKGSTAASNETLTPSEDGTQRLAEAFTSIPDSQTRASVLALIRSLAPAAASDLLDTNEQDRAHVLNGSRSRTSRYG